MKLFQIILTSFLFINLVNAQENKEDQEDNTLDSALSFRSIGPAFTSGRVADFAMNPKNKSEYYVAFAAGHIWKTQNNGTTFTPVFDKEGSYSVGCLKLDPNNTNVIWAGTGENNHQRSVSYGDGVYKSLDGGASWENMGLKNSRQIGMIAIDPRDSNIVFAAAEGSVWGSGNQRGLYKTIDGGKHWKKILHISENTGVNAVIIDPVNPDIMYATSEQRRRHVHIRIGGGPESAIWKSVDAGSTWRKLENGIPKVDKGGIGLAVSPVNHNFIYAIIEAAEGKGGFFRSINQGESWEKMNDYNTSGQYYAEIVCDPIDVNTIYATETYSKVSHDAGKTWQVIGNNKRHVDDHAIWIDPSDTNHFMIGGDGGIYETFDHAKNFIHKTNLPVAQFYRVNVDNSLPFYYVYGGTQDNNSFGGPSQTLFTDGTSRAEWIITLGGDGYWQAIDPNNPDIVYSEYQYGNLYRYDRKSGERIAIKPLPRKGEDTYKWNWNTPFILSPHDNQRLYMAANKVFVSDDRGNSWEVISEDITRKLPRDKWKVMGRYWGVDAVAKNVSTSLFGMAVSLTESKLKEGLLYVGTDDGVIQVTENSGKTWHKVTTFKTVPEYTYVSDILASKHNDNIVFASFDNRKRDDFTPYLLKSTDKGKTWESITSNLPKNGCVHTIEQDHVNPNLLFVGTEFGVFYSDDGGGNWTALKGGIPTISVRDMVIQERENDLVLATFGRGFYILDNYGPLRSLEEVKKKKAHLFPIKNALLYTPKNRGGYGFGSMPYRAENAAYGASFTYLLSNMPKSNQETRREQEKKLIKSKAPIPIPTPKDLYDETHEYPVYLLLTITDKEGSEVRKLTVPAKDGIFRTSWNLEYLRPQPIRPLSDFNPLKLTQEGLRVSPGTYFVKMDLVFNNTVEPLVSNQSFEVVRLHNTTLPVEDEMRLANFNKKLDELARVTWGASSLTNELIYKVNSFEKLQTQTTNISQITATRIGDLKKRLLEIKWQLEGERSKASYEEIQPDLMAIMQRLNRVIYVHNSSTSSVTRKQETGYQIIKDRLIPIVEDLKKMIEIDIPDIERMLNNQAAPWTSGRVLEFE